MAQEEELDALSATENDYLLSKTILWPDVDQHLPRPLPITSILRTLMLFSARRVRPALNLLPIYRVLDQLLFSRVAGFESGIASLLPVRLLVLLSIRRQRKIDNHEEDTDTDSFARGDQRYWLMANLTSLLVSLGTFALLRRLYERQQGLLVALLANAYPAWRSIKVTQTLTESMASTGRSRQHIHVENASAWIAPLRHWLTYWFIHAQWTIVDVFRGAQAVASKESGKKDWTILRLMTLLWLQSGEPCGRPSSLPSAKGFTIMKDNGGASLIWHWLIGPLLKQEPPSAFTPGDQANISLAFPNLDASHAKTQSRVRDAQALSLSMPESDSRRASSSSHSNGYLIGPEHPEAEHEGMLSDDFKALDSVWTHHNRSVTGQGRQGQGGRGSGIIVPT